MKPQSRPANQPSTLEMPTYIRLHSGRDFPLLNPQPKDIVFEDIAIGLSRAPRFVGQTNRTYSVASHSLFCIELLELGRNDNLEDHRWALLHDAAEAYICDIPSPLKQLIRHVIDPIEAHILKAVAQAFELKGTTIPDTVKNADRIALHNERRHLLSGPQKDFHIPEIAWTPPTHKDEFASFARYTEAAARLLLL